LNKDYIKKSLTPDFEKNFRRAFWDEFMQYKLSKDSDERTRQNKDNASKKKHFHHLGQGGYSSAIPKWQKMEEDLIARGIIPVTFYWTLQAKYFFYAHGGTLNMEDGSFVTTDRLREEVDRLDTTLKAVAEAWQRERRADIRSWDTGTHRTCPRHGRSSMEAWLQWRYRDLSKPMQKEG
jgi:hypothetical protein